MLYLNKFLSLSLRLRRTMLMNMNPGLGKVRLPCQAFFCVTGQNEWRRIALGLSSACLSACTAVTFALSERFGL